MPQSDQRVSMTWYHASGNDTDAVSYPTERVALTDVVVAATGSHSVATTTIVHPEQSTPTKFRNLSFGYFVRPYTNHASASASRVVRPHDSGSRLFSDLRFSWSFGV